MSPPQHMTIAIVGRPNVGKSTLFNRLTGRRTALVSNLPGLTRDRRVGTVNFDGHVLHITDTAGLEKASKGSIADRMLSQTLEAIKLADLVLFVLDVREGVTSEDEMFARKLHHFGKPVILLANKSEGLKSPESFYEAYRLGLGEPLPISAEHGEGIGGLIEDILKALGLKSRDKNKRKADVETEHLSEKDEAEQAEQRVGGHPLRVVIVGRPNAGKSTLVNALLGEERMITGPEPGLTRDAVFTDFESNGHLVRLFDTAGLRRKSKIKDTAEKLSVSDAVRAIRFAEVVVLLVDPERPLEHQDLTIGDLVTKEGRALVIALNKWDRIEKKQSVYKKIQDLVGMSLAQVPGVAVVPISALAETGLDKLMAAIFKAAEVWNRRVSTSQLNEWLQEALLNHAPPAVSGRPIKIRYITQPSSRPPSFVAFCSKPESLPKSYVKYLTNSLRAAFDLPGVPLRLSLRKRENPYQKN
ncbi:MAG: ribosome biogenesis GTPase Der [Hyphomicrobium sp.]